MTFSSIPSRLSVRTVAPVPRGWVAAARILLLLNAVVLAFSPLTEQIWTWDGFLRGSGDLELNLLVILAFCCLILVLAQHSKHAVALLLGTLLAWLSRSHDERFILLPVEPNTWFNERRATPPGFGGYRMLLQI